MKAQKFAATTLLTIAATTLTVATAYGQPADAVLSGTDRGVTYAAGLSPAGDGVSTTLDAGTFHLSDDQATVTVTGPDGIELARLPMTVHAEGQQVRLDPQIDSAGTTLTLRSADRPDAKVGDPQEFRESVSRIQEVGQSSSNTVAKDVVLLGCVPGLIVGGLIGGVIGAVVGALLLVVGAVVTIPLAAALGAALGCLIA
ncbi:hypothetical protein [Nocardia brasiliensis]|uniref:hypothetical protein n=1 Tax=Nocardia brasiliensis TaxID=37326 RepID=UPI002457025D|nr:hypothetical protein [Nocardia brasiliensis]